MSKVAEVLEVPLISLLTMGHEKSRPELLSDLHNLLNTADDSQLKVIHRLVAAVVR